MQEDWWQHGYNHLGWGKAWSRHPGIPTSNVSYCPTVILCYSKVHLKTRILNSDVRDARLLVIWKASWWKAWRMTHHPNSQNAESCRHFVFKFFLLVDSETLQEQCTGTYPCRIPEARVKASDGSCYFGLVAPLGSIVCFVSAFDSDRMFLFGNWIHEDNEVRNDNDYEDNEVHNDTAFVGINSTSSSCCITACVIESNNRIHRNSARCASGASSSVSDVFESSIHGWQKQL